VLKECCVLGTELMDCFQRLIVVIMSCYWHWHKGLH